MTDEFLFSWLYLQTDNAAMCFEHRHLYAVHYDFSVKGYCSEDLWIVRIICLGYYSKCECVVEKINQAPSVLMSLPLCNFPGMKNARVDVTNLF